MMPAVSRKAEPASFEVVRTPRPAPRAHAAPPKTPVAAMAAVPSHESGSPATGRGSVP